MTNENTKDIRTNTEVESQVDERDDTVVAPIENTEDATDETTAEVVVSDDADKNGEVDTDSSEEAEAETEDEDDSSVAIVPMAKKGMTTREKVTLAVTGILLLILLVALFLFWINRMNLGDGGVNAKRCV